MTPEDFWPGWLAATRARLTTAGIEADDADQWIVDALEAVLSHLGEALDALGQMTVKTVMDALDGLGGQQ